MKNDIIIVGEQIAGEAAKVRSEIKAAMANITKNTFEIARLLHKAREKRLYSETSFSDYTTGLGLKDRKAQYLVRIIDVMEAMDVKPAEYEKIGVGKLREISRLDPSTEATYTNPQTGKVEPMRNYITGLLELAPTKTVEEIGAHVRTLLGEVGENDMVWSNFRVLRQANDLTIKPAIEKMQAMLGTTKTDMDGTAIDASPGKCLELICARFLTDDTEGE